MSFSLKNSHRFPKRNLIFASVLLLLLSVLSSYYFRQNPSISTEVKKLQNYILKQEKDFDEFVGDSSLMRRLVQQQDQSHNPKQERNGIA